jgi:hypothetical protein
MNINQLPLTPESHFRDLVTEGVKAEIDLFFGVRMDFELEIINGDPSVRVYGTIQAEAEDIFGG